MPGELVSRSFSTAVPPDSLEPILSRRRPFTQCDNRLDFGSRPCTRLARREAFALEQNRPLTKSRGDTTDARAELQGGPGYNGSSITPDIQFQRFA